MVTAAYQPTFDELGTPLHAVTFVVVDLETTGGSAEDDRITEIGAVKVRAGEQIGELATLVDPGRGIPPQITVLTGITESMLLGAPQPEEVVASFLEWSRGCVIVAHNAPFDLGFLAAAARRAGIGFPAFTVIDTARLARVALTKDEAPDCRLSTLARVLHSRTVPNHRALADARATTDVLHVLLERVGSLGVKTLEELSAYSRHVPEHVRRKRHLAADLPHAPGVYVFRDGLGRALYVGTSRDLRTRVRSYFTASEPRKRLREMIAVAERVDHIPCVTALEAAVRELRLIQSEQPRYNRRSRFPEKAVWLTLTDEPWPRLALARRPTRDGTWLGPFQTARAAELAKSALLAAFPLRQCTSRIARRPVAGSACVLAEMGRCGAPCEGALPAEAYAAVVADVRAAVDDDPAPVLDAHHDRFDRLVAQQRFEEAGTHRDRLVAFVRAAARSQRAAALVRIDELVPAAPRDGGWEIHLVRRGRLAGATIVPHGASPYPYVDALVATGEAASTARGPAPAATPAETALILDWLGREGVRLVRSSQPWAVPARGATRLLDTLPDVPTRRRR